MCSPDAYLEEEEITAETAAELDGAQAFIMRSRLLARPRIGGIGLDVAGSLSPQLGIFLF